MRQVKISSPSGDAQAEPCAGLVDDGEGSALVPSPVSRPVWPTAEPMKAPSRGLADEVSPTTSLA